MSTYRLFSLGVMPVASIGGGVLALATGRHSRALGMGAGCRRIRHPHTCLTDSVLE